RFEIGDWGSRCMGRGELRLARFHRVGAAAHAVALSGDGEHLLVGSEHGLRLTDRSGAVKYRLGRNGRAFNAVALSPRLDAGSPTLGLAMERAGRLFRLDFDRLSPEEPADQDRCGMQIAAVGIWEQRDDLYSLDFAPNAGHDRNGLIALGHHALGLTALDGRGHLLWQLGPREGSPSAGLVASGRTWHAAISSDARTIYATALGWAAAGKRGEVMAIDAALGRPVRSVTLAGHATLLAALPSPLGVAAVVHRANPSGACCQVMAFDADLRNEVWSLPCPPDVTVTAVAAAPGQAVLWVGTNTGELWRLGAFTGRILARHDLLFASTVLSVAIAETGEIAAGLANGHVAFLERVKDGG
ncbi:MAG: hypothetical protein ACM30E_08675, partial [Nitrososphaerales archaeon]